jgi:hypothetical protein
MNLLKPTFLAAVFLSTALRAQKPVLTPVLQEAVQHNVPASNITRSTMADSAFLKVEMNRVQYDFLKNNLPYYLISKKTAYNQTASPKLIIRKAALVTPEHAGVIKKYFSKYLGSDFETIALASLCMNENLNQYKLHPFRLTADGQVEELLEYDVSWQVTTNENAKLMNKAAFKNASVLASGRWYKIGTTNNGIYKIDKAFLTSCGIDVDAVDPTKIRIYGNGGVMLPEANSAFRYDDLEENNIIVVGEGDGKFDDGDYILFYSKNKDKWTKQSGNALKYAHYQNIYSDTAFYFINTDIGPGMRVNTMPSQASSNATTTAYDYLNYHELNTVNFVKSGRQFFGEYFDINNSYTFDFNDGDFSADSLLCETSVAGRNASMSTFLVTGNGLGFNVNTNGVDVTNYLAPYADEGTSDQRVINTNPTAIDITVTKMTAGSIGWLDKITINARRDLVLKKQFVFRDARVCSPGKIASFNISNPSTYTPQLWNVTDPIHPFAQAYNMNGSSIQFNAATDSLMEFAIAPDNDFYAPTFVGTVENQNLHALQQADYVIVTHPMFTQQSLRLAQLHQANEGLSWVIATTDQIYNEFSSGMPDASAIRDFVRMLYTRNIAQGKQPKYLLLFGDGSYDVKSRNLSTNTNLIPTFQTPSSLSPLNSIATDDFYGLMDPNEGSSPENIGSMDVGVGRITVDDPSQASNVVSKIEHYYSKEDDFKIQDQSAETCTGSVESTMGDWRNWLIFLADDEDQSTHQGDADKIATKVLTENPGFNIDKIYIDAYKQFSTPGGSRYPDAYDELQKRIKKGALVFNYTGHGGEVGLTGERVVNIEDINGWDNIFRLPLFITATCEFTRYDDPSRTSAGELCLLNPNGAAISLFTTCRLAFSNSNLTLNSTIYDYMFKKLPDGRKPCLGDVVRRTKDTLNQSINYSNFHIIGDPAITLAFPQDKKVVTTMINTHTVTPTSSDTLGALAKITVKGYVADTLGNKITSFNGIVYPTVFDKEITVHCLLNDASSYYITPGEPFYFQQQTNILYRGKAEVKNGDFTFSFLVPKDITFSYGPGKISYYATNGMTDASGYYKKIVVGGGATNAFPDNEGPKITLYMDNKNFVNGGTTGEKPILYAQLIDSSGVNTLGTSIGHDITAVLDNNTSQPIILNDFYEANLNSYQSGRVRYPFDNVPEGSHKVSFKVWDIQNNSSVNDLDFVVAPSAELALNHVLNYPNPFSTATKFFFEHNQACNPMKVTVQIFTVSGKLVKTLHKSITCEGFRPEGIDWDGKDDYGDKLGRGVYIYRLAILTNDNKRAEKTEKLVILN